MNSGKNVLCFDERQLRFRECNVSFSECLKKLDQVVLSMSQNSIEWALATCNEWLFILNLLCLNNPKYESDFPDNIKGDRHGSDKKEKDCQGIALVAEGKRNRV